MTKKDYQKPTMKVVKLQHQTHLLQASVHTTMKAKMNDTWEEETI